MSDRDTGAADGGTPPTRDKVVEDAGGDVDPAAARVEEEVAESFRATVEKGAERLHRG
jgi:hypothetical protein